MTISHNTQFSGYASVSGGSAEATLITTNDKSLFSYIERFHFSVYDAADGEGGVLELLDENGTVLWRTNVDGIKDVPLDFGEYGMKVGKISSIHALVTGANTQAKIWIGITGHLEVD